MATTEAYLSSIVGKILAKIQLNRLNVQLDQAGLTCIPESQCSVKEDRGTIDMIFTARQLQDRCQEHNVKDALPTIVNMGRFRIRMFSDNKTECRICKEVGHPFYRCPMKNNPPPRICGRCKSSTHTTRECINDIVCNYCTESGHKQKDCPEYKLTAAQKAFGVYAHEILEGRQASEEDEKLGAMVEGSTSSTPQPSGATAGCALPDAIRINLDFESESLNENAVDVVHNKSDTEIKTVDDTSETNNKTEQDLPTRIHFEPADYMNFVIGDSNAMRIHVKDPDVQNLSKSGQKAADIKSLLDVADSQASANNKKVKRIVLHLGTNDVSKHKTDAAQVQLEVSTAISETHKKFPDAQIAFSSILPRRGKSAAIVAMNKTAKTVNDYIKKLAIKERYLSFNDNDLDILDKDVPIRGYYDSSDATGVHISVKGADMLADSFQDFFNCGPTSDDDHYMTPGSYKRNRSVLSNTPPSDKQISKTNKVVK